MQKKYLYFLVLFLVALNGFAWQEVFVLSQPRNLLVDFLDVGQGDSAFIETQEGHQILIDGGPDSSAVGKISGLIPFWDKEIDVVILTHPEKDHMGGLFDIFKKYKVDYILWAGVQKETAEFARWEQNLRFQQEMGAKVIAVKSGDQLRAGDALINILHPQNGVAGNYAKDVNATSVVSKVTYGKNSFLFVGDIDAKTEKDLDSLFQGNDMVLRADVLKVAHHGSKYSSSEEFLQTVNPFAATISVGKNSYGHPTPEVLQKLKEFGIKVLRTDTSGDIKMVSDGNIISIIK